MSYGVMGGQYQAMGHMQFLTRMFDYGMDIQEAQDAPRFMADPFSGEVEVEDTVPEAIRAELAAKGHRIVKPKKPVGGSQAIWIDAKTGVRTGGSDPRKDGCAIGYLKVRAPVPGAPRSLRHALRAGLDGRWHVRRSRMCLRAEHQKDRA